MLNNTLLLPICLSIAISLGAYIYSSDPDKKKKPLNFVIPGLIAGIALFLFLKYSPPNEKLMEGNYFD
jgi:hypothetical protein